MMQSRILLVYILEQQRLRNIGELASLAHCGA